MAAQYFFEKRYAKAATLYNEAQAIQQKSLGNDNPEVARTLRNLAITETALKHLPEAATDYGKAIGILEESHEAGAQELPSWLREYAQILRRNDQFARAEEADIRASGLEVRNAIAEEKLRRVNPSESNFVSR